MWISEQVWRSLGEGGEGDEEECRTSGAVPGVKLKPSPTLLSKVSFSSKFSSSSFSIQDKIGFLVLLLVLQLLNYFCPVSLSRPSWTRCSRRPSCPPLKFTLLCNRQKTLQIFPWKQLFLCMQGYRKFEKVDYLLERFWQVAVKPCEWNFTCPRSFLADM